MPPFLSAFLPNPTSSASKVDVTKSQPSPNPALIIAAPTTSTHIHALRRINALFLPIAYPEKFYTDLLPPVSSGKGTDLAKNVENGVATPADPTALALLAFWSPPLLASEASSDTTTQPSPAGKIIGGIRCRLELDPVAVVGLPQSQTSAPLPKRLYISTISLLSPYRGLGVASGLLEKAVKEGVRREGVSLVYAHVWEGNEGVLEWYDKRGFTKGELVRSYYRRLKPDGAWLVWKNVGIGEGIDRFREQQST